MKDSDSATIELSRNEAQEVINALSNYQFEVSGREEEQVLNVRKLLKREFGFEEPDFEGRGGADEDTIVDALAGIFDEGGGGEHEIRLSRTEADEVVRALADLEAESGSPGTVRDVRARFEERFDLTAGDAP